MEVEGPPPPPSETVLQLRKNYKLAAISQFVQLFKQHVGLDFAIEVSTRSPALSILHRLLSTPVRPLACLYRRRATSHLSSSKHAPRTTCRADSALVLFCRTWKPTLKADDQTLASPHFSANSSTPSPTTGTSS